jgi:hypothetical protein
MDIFISSLFNNAIRNLDYAGLYDIVITNNKLKGMWKKTILA